MGKLLKRDAQVHTWTKHGVSAIVYDVSNRDTFDALNTWWNEVNTYCSSPDVVKMIVGNKVDKVNGIRIWIRATPLLHVNA